MAEEKLVLSSTDPVKGQSGMSFDIGGSLIKLAFCRSDAESGQTTLTFRSFPISHLEEAISYCVEHHSDLIDRDRNLYTCGVNMGPSEKTLCERLNIKKPMNVSELDCFVQGFTFMYEHLSLEEMCYPPSEKAQAYLDRQTAEWGQMLGGRETLKKAIGEEDAKTMFETKEKEEQIEEPAAEVVKKPKYPVMLGLLGSGAGAFIVKEDCKFDVSDPATRSGRTFLGLGSLLTGEKTFDGLIELAKKGDINKSLVSGMHLKSEDEANVYSYMPDHLPLYSFGHAVGKDLSDFTKEDLAAGLLTTIAQDLAQVIHLNAALHQLKDVYFCGSFVGLSETVRDEVSCHFLARSAPRPDKVDHHHMRYGGYIGAIGALLRLLENKAKASAAEN